MRRVLRPLKRSYDRLVRFDPRSRAYRAREFVRSQALRVRTWSCDVVLDQGVEGACSGFAVCHEAAATPAVVPGISNEVAYEVYRQAQTLDNLPGEGYHGVSVLAAMKAGKARGWWGGYRWAFGEPDLAVSISHLGPAVLGLNWYQSMETPDDHGVLHVGGEVIGGHAILCLGFNPNTGMYTLLNSWGPDWGLDGRCYLSRADMTRLLGEDGEAVIPMKRRVPKPG